MNEQLRPVQTFATDPAGHVNQPSEIGRAVALVTESWRLIAGVAAAVFMGGLAYVLIAPPVYEANALVQVLQQQQGGLSGLEQLSSLIEGGAMPTNTEIQLVQSRATLVPVVKALQLDIAVSKPQWPVLSWFMSARPAAQAIKIATFEVPAALEGERLSLIAEGAGKWQLEGPEGNTLLRGHVGKLATAARAAAVPAGLKLLIAKLALATGERLYLTKGNAVAVASALAGRLDVSELGAQTGIVRLSLKGGSASLTAAVVNAIADSNLANNLRQRSQAASQQLAFLEKQLPGIKRRLGGAETELAKYKGNSGVLDLSSESQAFLQQAGYLEQEIARLETQKAELGQRYTNASPVVQGVAAQEKALQAQRGQLERRIKTLPLNEQKLVQLQGDVEVARNLYSALLGQEQTLQVAEAGTVGDVRIVDYAAVPTEPVAPQPLRIAGASLLAGLFLGIFAAVVRKALRQGIDDPETVETQLGMSVLAVIPSSAEEQKLSRAAKQHAAAGSGDLNLLAAIMPESSAVEGLRSFRVSLQFTLASCPHPVLCITSPGPEEGKSFLSSNLAYLYAEAGKRVVVVDTDLRRGHLHRRFGYLRAPGLTEHLLGKATAAQCIRPTAHANLFLVTTGGLVPNSVELLERVEFARFMETLKAEFDLVVLDTPPVLALTDTIVVAKHATHNLLLLRYGKHSLAQVRYTLRRYERGGIRVDGAVFNDMSESAGRTAYHYYGYQYSYRYK